MARRKTRKEVSIVRSSAAEYLSFVAASRSGGVEAVFADESVWLTAEMMGVLFDVGTQVVDDHLEKIFSDNELEKASVVRHFRMTGSDGKEGQARHYKLPAILAVGCKVDSDRAVQFRKWVFGIVEAFTIKAFVMDDERLKYGGSILTDQYFEEQLERIREIRLSERKFCQKITDLYATSIDYDVTAKATRHFFTTVQDKLHWAIHGHTTAELVISRAGADRQNMGLNDWKDSPRGKIQRFDVTDPENYLSEEELAQLGRLVSIFLDHAESMMQRKIPLTMQDWGNKLDRLIRMTDREVLQDTGRGTAEQARAHAESEFERYRIAQDRLFESDFDSFSSLSDHDRGCET